MINEISKQIEEIRDIARIQRDINGLPNWFKEKDPLGSIDNFEKADRPLHSMELNRALRDCSKEQNETLSEKIKEIRTEQILKNMELGAMREDQAYSELKEEYPKQKGYNVEREQYLRDIDGNIVKDNQTNESRRIDFIVTKDNVAVISIEVTSKTAPKELQSAKEERIRANGGNFVKDRETGKLVNIPENIKTEVRRYL